MQRSSSSVTRGPSSTFFGFFTLFSRKRDSALPVLDAEFLEAAFARLIADRAIERMIDEQEFHHAFAAFLCQRRIGANAHPFAHILRAGNLGTRHPIDYRFAVRTEFRFAIRSHFRQAHFDQAHPAVAGRGQFLVVTIARNVAAGLLARLDHARPLGELVPARHLIWTLTQTADREPRLSLLI